MCASVHDHKIKLCEYDIVGISPDLGAVVYKNEVKGQCQLINVQLINNT